MNLTISARGWVVIPAKLRKKYGLRPGSTVWVEDYGGMLALAKAMDDPVRQSAGMLYDPHDSLIEALLDEHARERRDE